MSAPRACRTNPTPFDNEITPEVSGIFSYANEDKTWGVGMSASYQKRTRRLDAVDRERLEHPAVEWHVQCTASRCRREMHRRSASSTASRTTCATLSRTSARTHQCAGSHAVRAHRRLTFTLDYTFAQQRDRGGPRRTDHVAAGNNSSLTSSSTPATKLRRRFTFATSSEPRTSATNSSATCRRQARLDRLQRRMAGSDTLSFGLDVHKSKTESLPNDPLTGGSATFVILCRHQLPARRCTGAWAQESASTVACPLAPALTFRRRRRPSRVRTAR